MVKCKTTSCPRHVTARFASSGLLKKRCPPCLEFRRLEAPKQAWHIKHKANIAAETKARADQVAAEAAAVQAEADRVAEAKEAARQERFELKKESDYQALKAETRASDAMTRFQAMQDILVLEMNFHQAPTKRLKKWLVCLEKGAALDGDEGTAAQFWLASFLYKGFFTVDRQRSQDLFESAALGGNAVALSLLGSKSELPANNGTGPGFRCHVRDKDGRVQRTGANKRAKK
jgi:hypothetical protein